MVVTPSIKSLRRLALRTIQIFPMLFAYSEPSQQLRLREEQEQMLDGYEGEFACYHPKQKYWTSKSPSELIDLADEEFMRGNYLEVYELLNRLKYSNNTDVQWRIARSLYKLSKDDVFSYQMRKEMIGEAYELLTNLNPEDSNPHVYKWLAIILDAKNSYGGLEQRVRAFPDVRECLMKAIQLNPEDATSYYILGKWCFDISQLSRLQRLLTTLLYGAIPETSFEEAYQYLLKSYQIQQDNYYIPIMYMLGEACYRMNQFYRAEFYLKNAVTLQPRTKFESECLYKAQRLLKQLDLYDLSKETVLFEYPF